MFRPHSTSTLFPYTTLFRSCFGLRQAAWQSHPPPVRRLQAARGGGARPLSRGSFLPFAAGLLRKRKKDRKSTRLNSSHANISYAVFCLKKKKITQTKEHVTP